MERVDLYHYKATQTEKEYRTALEAARSAQQRANQARSIAQVKREQLWKEVSSLKNTPLHDNGTQEIWKNGGVARLEVASREFRNATKLDTKAHGELAASLNQVQRATVKRDLSQALHGAEKRRIQNGKERIREEEVMDLGIIKREQGRFRSRSLHTAGGEEHPTSARPDTTTVPLETRPRQELPRERECERPSVPAVSPLAVVSAQVEQGDGKAKLRMACETSSGVPVGMVLSQDGSGGVHVKLCSLSRGIADQLLLERSALMSKVSALGIRVTKVEVSSDGEGLEFDTHQPGTGARARRTAEEDDENVIA